MPSNNSYSLESRIKHPVRQGAKSLCITLLLIAALPGCSPALAADTAFSYFVNFDAKSRPRRVLPFSREFSLGEILIGTSASQLETTMLHGAARGTIIVPAGRFVSFIPSSHFYEQPDRINIIPPDGLDSIQINAMSMDDKEDGLCDRALAHIGHCKGLIRIELSRSDASDKGVVHLVDLPNLQEISAFAAMIDGSCFKNFSAMKHLKCINLHGNPVKDENLKYLAAMPSLERLSLASTGVSDAGIKNLVVNSNLTQLDLGSNRKITDASIASLRALKSLRVLRLSRTSISTAGILKLRGLPLTSLLLPQQTYSNPQLKSIRAAFPQAAIMLEDHKNLALPDETKDTFAPLH